MMECKGRYPRPFTYCFTGLKYDTLLSQKLPSQVPLNLEL